VSSYPQEEAKEEQPQEEAKEEQPEEEKDEQPEEEAKEEQPEEEANQEQKHNEQQQLRRTKRRIRKAGLDLDEQQIQDVLNSIGQPRPTRERKNRNLDWKY
jgi:hypothetical protein